MAKKSAFKKNKMLKAKSAKQKDQCFYVYATLHFDHQQAGQRRHNMALDFESHRDSPLAVIALSILPRGHDQSSVET